MTAHRWITRWIATTPLLLLATAVSAESMPSGADWDATHMRSNFANQSAAAARPAIRGLDANGQIAHDASNTQVQETWLTVNPHGWEPGAGARKSTNAGRPFARGTGFSSTSSAAAQRSGTLRAESASPPRRGTRQ